MLKKVLILLAPVFLLAQNIPEITADEVIAHIRFLASDRLQGRRAGTVQAETAAKYIASEFQRLGLEPAGDNNSWFQSLDVILDMQAGPENRLTIQLNGTEKQLQPGTDFNPLAFSAAGEISAGLSFVGYGLTEEDYYNDYQDIDVSGRVAVMFRYTPAWDSSEARLSSLASLRFKAINAREHGAVAAVIITGPLDSDRGDIIALHYDNNSSDAGIPVISLSRSVAQELFAANGMNMKEVQQNLSARKNPQSVNWKTSTVNLKTDLKAVTKSTDNVLAVLPGKHPRLKNEYIVIGAHYDHLGLGGAGSMADKPGEPHNGADDNASGTAGLLELAEYFSEPANRSNRSLLFAAFTAEELGVLGSTWFTKHPTIDADKIITMINMDMIGRMKDKRVVLYGMGSSGRWEPLVNRINKDFGFRLKFNAEGYGPSDHSPFYGKDIPVLFFFTGTHSDYHRPSDDWQKINAEDEARLLQFVSRTIRGIDERLLPPQFTKAKTKKQKARGGGRRSNVFIGTVPDFTDSGNGYKLAGVSEGSPAESAGLKSGDLIIRFAGSDIGDIYDFMYAMQKCKPGKAVEVVFRRGETEMTTRLIPAPPRAKDNE